MCLFRFLCFNGVCGFRVYTFLVDYMFLSCSSITHMFLCQGHVSKVKPCFTSWNTFIYQSHVLVSMFLYQVFVFVSNRSFKSKECFR
jgi:hypothetical protein